MRGVPEFNSAHGYQDENIFDRKTGQAQSYRTLGQKKALLKKYGLYEKGPHSDRKRSQAKRIYSIGKGNETCH